MDVLSAVNHRTNSIVRNPVIRHPRKSDIYTDKFRRASFEEEGYYIFDLTERNRAETSQLIAILRDIIFGYIYNFFFLFS
jgi:hypothetical protein